MECWLITTRAEVMRLEFGEEPPVEIYLPIADLPVNILVILAMGLAVGFISGMFGIPPATDFIWLSEFSRNAPAVTMRSPGFKPFRISTRSPKRSPVSTSRGSK